MKAGRATVRIVTAGVVLAASVVIGTHGASASPPTIGAVTGFSIDQRADGKTILLFQIVGEPRAACTIPSQGYANYAVDLTKVGGRAIYASVLAAQLSGRVLGVLGSDTCNTDPRGEDISHADQYQ